MSQRKYLKPSYDEIRELSLALYYKVRSSGFDPQVNVGIGRGGLFVLRSLQDFYAASKRKIPYLVAVAERYMGIDRAGRVSIKYMNARGVRGKRVLVIDDVADYGYSLMAVKEKLEERGVSEVKTATLHVKPWSKLIPDYYIVETDAWIIYPWELYESIGQILELLADEDANIEDAYREIMSNANITPQELSNFNDVTSYDQPLKPKAQKLLRGLLSMYTYARKH